MNLLYDYNNLNLFVVNEERVYAIQINNQEIVFECLYKDKIKE